VASVCIGGGGHTFAVMEKLARGNVAEVLNVLGGRLTFDRNGVKLYDAVIEKIKRHGEPRYDRMLGQLRHIRGEEKEHEEWLEAQIRALGGSAHETTTKAELETRESSGIEAVIVDGEQRVLHLLHGLLAAELADNAGWDLLVKLADAAGDTRAKLGFMKRMEQEMEHLAFIREAVIRAAEIQILGRDQQMPSGMGSVLAGSAKKPLAVAGVATALALGVGALAASALLIAKPKLIEQSRRALHAA
jgi:bacterioferritin (cytochrome b1)